MTVHVYSLLGQTEGGRKVLFLKVDWGKRRVHGETSKNNWFLLDTKKSLFFEIQNNSTPLCYFSDLVTNNYINVNRSMIYKISRIDSRIYRKSPFVSFQGKMCREIWYCHVHQLLLESSFYGIPSQHFKINFNKQPTNLAPFLPVFLYF